MSFPEFDTLDAMGLAALVREGEVSAGECLEAALARIDARNPALNAVIARDDAAARGALRSGLPAGPLHGVPVLLKDLLPWRGRPVTMGSNLLRKNVATETAPVLERLLAAGIVVVGRTNTPELGLLPLTEPTLYGPTANPWDLARSPGGSSGGSAAAVAARMVPLAHGNDGGGSIRIPASACGLFGLKPSRGRNPASTLEPPDGFASEHVLTRTVRDSALVLDLTQGARPGDRWRVPPPRRGFLAACAEDPPPLRIAFTTSDFAGEVANPCCKAAVESTARLCAELGHQVEEASPLIDAEAYNEAFKVIWSTGVGMMLLLAAQEIEKVGAPRPAMRLLERRAVLERVLDLSALGSGKPALEPFTLRLGRIEAQMTPGATWVAWQELERASRSLAHFFEGFDLLLTPTLGQLPWLTGEFDQSLSTPVLQAMLQRYVAYTPLANTAGVPAMSVPLDWSEEGLPLGSQFIAPFGEEEALFALAGQLERARPWIDRRPPMVADHLSPP